MPFAGPIHIYLPSLDINVSWIPEPQHPDDDRVPALGVVGPQLEVHQVQNLPV